MRFRDSSPVIDSKNVATQFRAIRQYLDFGIFPVRIRPKSGTETRCKRPKLQAGAVCKPGLFVAAGGPL